MFADTSLYLSSRLDQNNSNCSQRNLKHTFTCQVQPLANELFEYPSPLLRFNPRRSSFPILVPSFAQRDLGVGEVNVRRDVIPVVVRSQDSQSLGILKTAFGVHGRYRVAGSRGVIRDSCGSVDKLTRR